MKEARIYLFEGLEDRTYGCSGGMMEDDGYHIMYQDFNIDRIAGVLDAISQCRKVLNTPKIHLYREASPDAPKAQPLNQTAFERILDSLTE
jgi:hypothetical protein